MSQRRLLLTSLLAISIAFLAMVYHRLISPTVIRQAFNSPSFTTMSQSSPRPVIVVGSGLAGLCASYEALKAGAIVHMLDRAPKPGGNSIKASSGINGAGTRFQKASGIDTDDLFYSDTVESAGSRFAAFKASGKGVDREKLVQVLTRESSDAVTWMVDEIGVDLSVVAPLGGHSVARTHRGAGKLPPGAAMVTALLGKLKENPNFTLTSGAEVQRLTQDDGGAVTGVEYVQDSEAHALQGPVMFATGGFAGDANGYMARYRPDLKGYPATAEMRPGTQDILTAVGAELVDMDSVQIHPTGFVDPAAPHSLAKFLAAELLRGEGGILLSSSGERFVNEMETREHVSDTIVKTPPVASEDGSIRQWDVSLLLDPGACEAAATHLGFYIFKGLMQKKQVKDLDPAMIRSVDQYARIVAGETEDKLGRKDFGHWTLKAGEQNREEEVCVGKITPVVHFTMGGVAFNERAQVLGGPELKPITGLYAAGEVTGGIHGDNRLGGSSLLECVVFGRKAGAEAAKET